MRTARAAQDRGRRAQTKGVEGYAAPAPMPEWAQPHLQCDEFDQLVASEQTAAELACVADLNALDDEFERLVGPAALSPPTDSAPGIADGHASNPCAICTRFSFLFLFVSAFVRDRRGLL